MRGALPALLLAAALYPGCSAMRRGADNGMVVATTPIHALTTPAGRFADGWREDPLSTAATAPLFVPIWVVGDLFFSVVSAVDLALTPAYIPWEVHRPRLYDLRRFPPRLREEVVEDAGDVVGMTVVFIAPFAAIVLACTGKGTWYPPDSTEGYDPDR